MPGTQRGAGWAVGILVAVALAACGPYTAEPAAAPAHAAAPPDPAEVERVAAAAMRARIDGITALERLYDTTAKGDEDRPKLLLRLADGYAELETEHRREAARAPDPFTAQKAERVERHARSRAIELYTALQRQYPAFCHHERPKPARCIDDVLVRLAHEHGQAREPEKARAVYADLIERFPDSRFVPDAYLALAERAFDEAGGDPDKLAMAAVVYEAVVKHAPAQHAAAAHAHYKLGKIHGHARDHARAVAALAQAVALAEKDESPAGIALAGMARADLHHACSALVADGADPLPPACSAPR